MKHERIDVSLLGIDVGTSGCKSAAFSQDGQLLGLAYEEYDYQSPQPGWAELDSEQIWRQVKLTLAKTTAATKHDPVQALCVSSLGEAVVPTSLDRKILGPALLNFDNRGSEYISELNGAISNERFYSINGNTLGNQYSLTKLKWIKQHQPELYRQTDFFLHWSGFVSFMLGAEARVDYSLANRTLLFDLEGRDWSDEILKAAELDREKLPITIPSGEVIGSVERTIADELGLPAGIPIISGAHDQCCNGIGCGVISPGTAMYGMGTYLCMMPVFSSRPDSVAMIERGLNTEHHAVPEHFVSFLYNQGGSLVKWYRNTFASAEYLKARTHGQDLYPILLAEMPDDPSRIMILPYFTVTGPPKFVADSSGLITGLRLETSRGEILKGLLEGMTFYIREASESLPEVDVYIEHCHAVGGGSKSDEWIQISADILGKQFIRPKINEAGVLGAAILAGVGCKIFPTLEIGVRDMVRFDQQFDPDPLKQSLYHERFAMYKRLSQLTSEYLHDQNSII